MSRTESIVEALLALMDLQNHIRHLEMEIGTKTKRDPYELSSMSEQEIKEMASHIEATGGIPAEAKSSSQLLFKAAERLKFYVRESETKKEKP